MGKEKQLQEVPMTREYFMEKNAGSNKAIEVFRTKCCDEEVGRHILNKNVPEELEHIEARCEAYLNEYSSAESITPLFCECGRLSEYIVKLDNKKRW
jgi:hypothetical protein